MSLNTKHALEEALKKLLYHKPIDKITIQELTEACGINRMTFYYHFKDIYDLVEWCAVEDARAALEQEITYDTWQQGFLLIFDAVRTNKPFIMNVYHSVSREQVEIYLYKLTGQLVENVVDERAWGLNVSPNDKQFLVDFYKFALVGLVLDWIRKDMKEDPKDIVDRLERVVRGNLAQALENLASSPAFPTSTP
ncbi:Transcriptional regulator, TetR family [Clostridiaceae bacterium JG1575]|nr:Transcriptional regulator, TetR family [Clostridiaceae bacterium JG1575]